MQIFWSCLVFCCKLALSYYAKIVVSDSSDDAIFHGEMYNNPFNGPMHIPKGV